MSWGSAAPVLVVAAVFDLLRGFFNFFWFFGPVLAALYCVQKVGGWVGSLWGLTETICAGAATIAGAKASAVTIPLGTIMAFAVAIFGFLTIGLWVLMTNARIFKTITTAPIEFAAAFAVGSMPLIGAVPTFSLITWRLYGAQIKTERVAFQKWEKENAAAALEEKRRLAAYAAQIQAAQQAQFMDQEAANDEFYNSQREQEAA